jgi:hypothetical protein
MDSPPGKQARRTNGIGILSRLPDDIGMGRNTRTMRLSPPTFNPLFQAFPVRLRYSRYIEMGSERKIRNQQAAISCRNFTQLHPHLAIPAGAKRQGRCESECNGRSVAAKNLGHAKVA